MWPMQDQPAYRATALGAAYARIDRLPVTVLLDNIRSLYNVGAFFRTADAVKAERICLAGICPTPDDMRIAKTALGAERVQPWIRSADPLEAIIELQARGYEVAAVETTLHALDLFDWPARFPVCIVFGHEVDGISPALLERCDIHVRIPTLGTKQSINVATAGGVVLYELLRKYRRRLEGKETAASMLPAVSSPA